MRSAASAGRSTRPAGPRCPRSRSTPPRYSVDQPCRRPAQRLARDPDPERRQRLDLRARHQPVRQARTAQTLEPRLLLRQHAVPSPGRPAELRCRAKDFNFDSIFTENTFSGVDRVSDCAPADRRRDVARWSIRDTGAEALRLGIVQRYLFSDQRVTPDGQPLTQRFSDILVLGSTSLVPNWTLRRPGCSTTRTAAGSCARSRAFAIRPGRTAPSA